MRAGRRTLRVTAVAIAAVLCAAAAQAQFGRGFGNRARVATLNDFDGSFHYCRLVYRSGFGGFGRGGGGSWTTDYPNADINMSIRLAELTRIKVGKLPSGDPNHLLVDVRGDELFQCPLVIMSAPGSSFFDENDARRLREYLLKGGMLWTDDSWGSAQWANWVTQISKVLPPEQYPIIDVPL